MVFNKITKKNPGLSFKYNKEDECGESGIFYTWIYLQEKNCRQFRLLVWTSFIDRFVHPVGGEVMG